VKIEVDAEEYGALLALEHHVQQYTSESSRSTAAMVASLNELGVIRAKREASEMER
jgi:hypothetical protein